jgi:hypothetical protein
LGALALALPLTATTAPAHAAASDLTYSKAQTFVAVEPGASASAKATCPVGMVAVNGSFQVDSDHTGRAADLSITESRRTATREWTAAVSNGSPARVTGNVRVTCLGAATAGGAAISYGEGAASDTFGDVEEDGTGATTATCPGAQPIAIGSGWKLTGGDAYLTASGSDGTSWSHSFEGAGATSVESYVYCVDDGAGAGATAVTIGLVPTAEVPPASKSLTDGSSWDATATCPVDSLAVAGTFEALGAGVYQLGSESATRTMRQRFYNDSGAASTVTTDVVCLTSTAVAPPASPERSVTENDDTLTLKTIGGKTFLIAKVTCNNFTYAGTVVAKAFKQNANGSRGARVATGKMRYSGATTTMRLQVSSTVAAPATDALILVLSAGDTTTVTKDVDVALPPAPPAP